jgi:hypothetical protein
MLGSLVAPTERHAGGGRPFEGITFRGSSGSRDQSPRAAALVELSATRCYEPTSWGQPNVFSNAFLSPVGRR